MTTPPLPNQHPSPQIDPATQQIGYLKALEISFYVWSGLHIFVIGYLVIYILMFGFMGAVIPAQSSEPALPMFMGAMGLILLIPLAITIGSAALSFFAGRAIAKRERKTHIYIAAAVACLGFPFGTVLGIFTFIVLTNPIVEQLFLTDEARMSTN